MTRSNDPDNRGWFLSSREMRLIMFFVPLAQIVFAAGAAYAGVRSALNDKVDKVDYVNHVNQTNTQLDHMRIADSISVQMAKEDRERIREIVCQAVKGCR